MVSLCNDWRFTERWSEAFLQGAVNGVSVRLPHTVREIPLHYAGPEDYEMHCGYCRELAVLAEWKGKRLFLQFDGAAHAAKVYINGALAGEHACGYTAFRVEITNLVRYGEDNRIAVELDTTENGAIPPFGFVIDYLTYGGLYREVWLDVRGPSVISDVFISTPNTVTASVKLQVDGGAAGKPLRRRVSLWDGGNCVTQVAGLKDTFEIPVPYARPWEPESPQLYICRTELLDENSKVVDIREEIFGFRTVSVKNDGVYLNGRRILLRGLNRHQSWPYIGYAAPASLQREDARILKHELQCNAVRTSHYPQSQAFLDACDREGLLVFTELPGWQHVGGEKWKQQALENLREMVLQYRNHPSIFLWGVRINESQDDDGFYARANNLCRKLDPTRQTSGVRFIEKSSLLEDVYAYNDFSHNGTTPGAKPKKSVTPDMDKPLLISEHNGHMYPTKSFDTWEKRQEHALRHARVLNAVGDGEHVGAFGWCMFDYPTHKDFGSGDRICYHGVMDAFRNPKLAAALYASQGDEMPVLELGTSMDIGDYPAGQLGEIYAFTNADMIRLYKNGAFVSEFRPQGWNGLAHGPVKIDDTIGRLIETQENLPHKEAELLRRCLISAGKYGLANMPTRDKMGMLRCMAQYHLSMQDGVDLYSKYVGNWGGEATVWRFEAVKDGKTVSVQEKCPGKRLHLELRPSATELHEGDSYDMAAVRIRILDEHNNIAPYAQLPVSLRLEGVAELAGPSFVTAEGGMCGTYIRTSGNIGDAVLTVSTPGLPEESIRFAITGKE